MWHIFGQHRTLQREVYDTLKPGDLYGGEHRAGRQPEDLVRVILLANCAGLAFGTVMLSGVTPGDPSHESFIASVWLMALGTAIALGAWALFRWSRAGEVDALRLSGLAAGHEAFTARIRRCMKRAAMMKLLGYRVMIVSGISFCVGLYTTIRGLFAF